MFSRLLNTAKSFISPTYPPGETSLAPSTANLPNLSEQTTSVETANTKADHSRAQTDKQGKSIEGAAKSISKRTTRVHSPDMVTTRQNAASRDEEAREAQLTDENSINVYVPSSISAKGKKRGIAEEIVGGGTPDHSVKKRKVAASPLLVEEAEADAAVRNTRLVVEIPASKSANEIAGKAEVEKKKGGGAKNHKKFDSDDEGAADEVEVFSTARDIPVVEGEEDEGSSDDEAPEEVGAQSAAKEVKLQKQSAQQAIQSLKRKRKQRSSELQKKRKEPAVESDADSAEDSEAPEEVLGGGEILSDTSESDSESDSSLVRNPTKGNRTKFTQTSDQPVKDRIVGKTTYRVGKVQSKNLAPKSEKRAKDTKEDWLKGRNGKKGLGATRKPMKKGFL